MFIELKIPLRIGGFLVFFISVCLVLGWVLVNSQCSTFMNLSNSKALGVNEINRFLFGFCGPLKRDPYMITEDD